MKLKILVIIQTITFLFLSCNKTPIACFDYTPKEIYIFDTVYFENCSENAQTYYWDFGDDSVSTEENPFHIYTQLNQIPTIYSVKLIAKNGDNSDLYSKKITVHHWGEILEGKYKGNLVHIIRNDTAIKDTILSCSLSFIDFKIYWSNLGKQAFSTMKSKYKFSISIITEYDTLKGDGIIEIQNDTTIHFQAENNYEKICFNGLKIRNYEEIHNF